MHMDKIKFLTYFHKHIELWKWYKVMNAVQYIYNSLMFWKKSVMHTKVDKIQ